MTTKLGIIMDPISNINVKKDTSLAMLLEAQQRHWSLYYMEQQDLFLQDGIVSAQMKTLQVKDDPKNWFQFNETITKPLNELDIILMRKDPPFDNEYVYTTYILELVENPKTLIINKPRSLRDYNEKLATAWFPQCCPPMLVSKDPQRLHAFLETQKDIILKPLHSMGGASVFRLRTDDNNINVTIEVMTENGQRTVMAQRFLPEVLKGDKRILIINGEAYPYALARIPPEGDSRGNLAIGAKGVGIELTKRDRWICEQVGPTLRNKGLIWAGIDVIGDYLTEINVTSPTCTRELDALYNLNISAQLLDAIS